jgi:outer membrane protein OmpA-like peptidoglycan-associated protein
MKPFKTSILAAASALVLAASAQAGTAMNEKVVRSIKFGNVVVDSQGDCVVSKWESTTNDCKNTDLRNIYFPFNSSALTAESKGKLNQLAASLKSDKVSMVKIVGYTDVVGSDSYNQRLSEKRANAVAAYLRGKGIKVNGNSEIRGLGKTSSAADCEGKKGSALHACIWRDRRAEVEIVQ